jgi:hypothetical protein
VINFVVVLLAIIFPYRSLIKSTLNVHTKKILLESGIALLSVSIGTALAGLFCYLLSFYLDVTDHAMSW